MARQPDCGSYQALTGVHGKLSSDEMKAAFRSLAKEFHQAVLGVERAKRRGCVAEGFAEIVKAHQVLRDSDKPGKYDQAVSHLRRPGHTGP